MKAFKILLALAAVAAFAGIGMAPPALAGDCNNCNPKPLRVTACLTPAQWAACPTKSWWADSKDHRDRTPRFFARCGTVERTAGSPNLGYRAADGGWVVFRFR